MTRRVLLLCAVFAFVATTRASGDANVTFSLEPITQYIHIAYPVPADAPDLCVVRCAWSPRGANAWQPARVQPYTSETALRLAPDVERSAWAFEGKLIERRAAGLTRSVVFNPYPDAIDKGRVNVDFRITLTREDTSIIKEMALPIDAAFTSAFYIEDWSGVIQKNFVAMEAKDGQWQWRSGLDLAMHASHNDGLFGASPPDRPLPQLTYPLDLKGWHAIYICTAPNQAAIRLRLSSDERADTLGSRFARDEVLWGWRRMDRQHLVLRQPHQYTGYTAASIDYVKFVPLTEEQAAALDAQFGTPDKLVAGYFEPYSWAFVENVQDTAQHREPLTAFAQARIGLTDIQIGRVGDKVVYESRHSDPLLHSTIGDPIGAVAQPTTDNVGRMQQYTNTLETELRYARDLGINVHANLGAGACYHGTPLEGDFSKAHPEWRRGDQLRFEIPEVRAYALGLYREALEIGAPGVSIDFCRYPGCIDAAPTATLFLRELRALCDGFAKKRGAPVKILVRFPGTGVRMAELFDYATWAREGLAEYLCPSNIQGRHMHIDMAPYIDALAGTKSTLLPCIDALAWGPEMPGPFLWRAAQLYRLGVAGLYIYQADGRVLGWPSDLRTMRLLSSGKAVAAWWDNEQRERPRRSKGIYITPPHEFGVYHGWERLRIWTEGVELGPLECLLDGKLAHRCEGPPYLVGSEENASDNIIPPGEHTLLLRAKDGDGWLEQSFAIKGAK